MAHCEYTVVKIGNYLLYGETVGQQQHYWKIKYKKRKGKKGRGRKKKFPRIMEWILSCPSHLEELLAHPLSYPHSLQLMNHS